jgi:N utilization substance protein A
VNDAEKEMEVIVEDKQLSLAIGKKGQNVRLAAKLTGWKIDIKSEEEKRKEVEIQLGALEIGEPASEATNEAANAAEATNEAANAAEVSNEAASAVEADNDAANDAEASTEGPSEDSATREER